jgi:anti-anti-sigma regulatory factor
MPGTCALPAELTIYVAAELRLQWLPWLASDSTDETLVVEADAVAEVDAAGLQLLASLAVALQARGRELCLRDASAALRKGCENLGMADLLSPTAEPA